MESLFDLKIYRLNNLQKINEQTLNLTFRLRPNLKEYLGIYTTDLTQTVKKANCEKKVFSSDSFL